MKRRLFRFDDSWIDGLLGHTTRPAARWLVVLALPAVAAVAAHVANRVLFARAEVVRLDLLVVQAQTALAPPVGPVIHKQTPSERQSVEQRNGVMNRLNTPWADVLDGLESRASPDVGLTLVEPDGDKGVVRIQAEAKSIDALLAYADDFARDPGFAGVSVRQHDTNEQDPNRPARLTFEVRLLDARRPVGQIK